MLDGQHETWGPYRGVSEPHAFGALSSTRNAIPVRSELPSGSALCSASIVFAKCEKHR